MEDKIIELLDEIPSEFPFYELIVNFKERTSETYFFKISSYFFSRQEYVSENLMKEAEVICTEKNGSDFLLAFKTN